MKIKKSLGIVLSVGIITSILCVASVYAINKFSLYNEINKMGDGFVKKGSLDDILNASLADNSNIEHAADKLVTKVNKLNDFRILGITKTGEILSKNSAPRSLYAINQVLPIECLRKVNEDLIYAVYKVKDESGLQYYMYCFFSKQEPLEVGKKEETELWWLTGRVMFANKLLTQKSFDNIKIGSLISEVAEIDSLTNIYKPNEIAPYKAQKYDEKLNKYVEYVETPAPTKTLTTYHLAKDGIICISYARDEQGEFTVSNISFNDTFDMPSNIKNDWVKLKIKVQDYPAATIVKNQVQTKEEPKKKVKVIVKDKEVAFEDAEPIIKSGRTLIPVRAVTTALGAEVSWNEPTKTVTVSKSVYDYVYGKSKMVIELKIDSDIIVVNGSQKKIDVPAQIYKNRTVVPLRFIADTFKNEVLWDEKNSTVIIKD